MRGRLIALGLGALALAAAASGRTQTKPSADGAAARVTALADAYLAAYFETFPEEASRNGIPKAAHGRIRDNSLSAVAAWERREDRWIEEIRSIDPAGLVGTPAWAAYGVLRHAVESSIDQRVCHSELQRVGTLAGWQRDYSDLARIQPVGTLALRRDALSRLRALPRLIDTEIANLREGVRRGYVVPKVIAEGVIAQMDSLLASTPEASPFASPVARDGDPEFRRAMTSVVNPAIRRYRDYLATEYLPAARASIGLLAAPDGPACYRALVRRFVSLDVAPDEIHALGLERMNAIEAEMKTIAERSFGTSDVAAVLERLKTESTYVFGSADEVVAYAQAAIDRIQGLLPKAFGIRPVSKVRIDPYPEFQAKAGAPGQYMPGLADGSRPGIFMINTWEPAKRSRAGLEALAFHEAYPGHHFQMSIALERSGIHPVGRYLWNSGFVEGWGLYAERVADEMGAYSSDVDLLGLLASESGRAARLVIDAGIHARGMTRPEAVAYLRAHTTRPPNEIEGEVNRYISWPGQATSYMLGAVEIRRLRDQAQRALGSRFEIRGFHDLVLEDGNITLPMLKSKIERWIAAERP